MFQILVQSAPRTRIFIIQVIFRWQTRCYLLIAYVTIIVLLVPARFHLFFFIMKIHTSVRSFVVLVLKKLFLFLSLLFCFLQILFYLSQLLSLSFYLSIKQLSFSSLLNYHLHTISLIYSTPIPPLLGLHSFILAFKIVFFVKLLEILGERRGE